MQPTPFTFRGKPVVFISAPLVDGRARVTPKGRKIERASDGSRICGKLFRAPHEDLKAAILEAKAGAGFVTREGKRYASYI